LEFNARNNFRRENYKSDGQTFIDFFLFPPVFFAPKKSQYQKMSHLSIQQFGLPTFTFGKGCDNSGEN